MRRSVTYLLAVSTASVAIGACESPTAVTADVGPVVALDSLRSADASALPCCTIDSAGARVTIVAGTLTFRRYLHYTDTAATPAGPMSAACVTEVPNGGTINAATGLVTVGDTAAYLVIPCHVGTYTLALTERLDFLRGSSRVVNVAVSSGTYAWQRDTLSLMNDAGQALSAMMSWDSIIVAAPRHTYKFQAVALSQSAGSGGNQTSPGLWLPVMATHRIEASPNGALILQVSAFVPNTGTSHFRVGVGDHCPLYVRIFPDPTGEYRDSLSESMACPPASLTLDLAPGHRAELTRTFTSETLATFAPGTYGINVAITTSNALVGLWAGAVELPLSVTRRRVSTP